MGPDDILVIAAQEFTLRGKDLYQASYALMSYFSGHCRRGTIADGYAGPAQLPPADAPYDPGDTGGNILAVRVEVIADTLDRGTTTAIEVMHRGFDTLGRALPDQYTADEIQLLTIAIGGDALTVSHLDRDTAYRRAGSTEP
ncbi:hypothetical protein [Pseudonocardia sp. ICBG1293]|uniref:hypothetical protein n=1 Tax=Pseudonocardia sp. ICBG1293 TaxID=2844382 RepID=UPI001CCD484C|nr:hypothetical protein [Pseudonocardia sp. ICBG1293]